MCPFLFVLSQFGFPAYLIVQRLLNDLFVPLERLSQLVDPVVVNGRLFSQTDEGHAKGRLLNCQPLIAIHLESLLAVVRDPGRRPRIFWQHDTNFGCFRQNDRSEGKRVRTDGCQGDHFGAGVNDATTAGEVVRG